MLRKKLVFILFGAILSFKSLSVEPHSIDTSEILKQIETFDLDENILNFKSSFFNSILFKDDTTLFYNPEYTLYLFEIKLGAIPKVTMLSNPTQASHTVNKHLFLYNNIIFSLLSIK